VSLFSLVVQLTVAEVCVIPVVLMPEMTGGVVSGGAEVVAEATELKPLTFPAASKALSLKR
jgi:hypothetical protein